MENKKLWQILCFIGIGMTLIAAFVIISSFENFKTSQELLEKSNKDMSTNLELSGEKYSVSHLYDENNNEVTLDQYADKPMVLLFFNTKELKASDAILLLEENYEKYKSQINFVNIALIDGVVETKENIANYITDNSITMPVLYDSEYTAKEEYKVEKIPTFVFVNKNQEIINTIDEEENITQDVIEANLDILSENY